MLLSNRMNNLSIRNKLRLFTLGTCLVLTAFFLGSVWKSTNSAVQTDVQQELNEELLQFNTAEQNRLGENLLAGKDVADSAPAPDILNSRDPAKLCDWARHLVGQSGLSPRHRAAGDQPADLDLVSLVYPDGTPLGFVLSRGKSIVCESRRTEAPFPLPKDRTKPELTDWEARDGNLYELVQVPVLDASAHELGRLVIGFQIDGRLADRIAGTEKRQAKSGAQSKPASQQTLQVALWHLDDPDPQTGLQQPHILAVSDGGSSTLLSPDSLKTLFAGREKKDPFETADFTWKGYRFLTERFGESSTMLFDNREHVRLTVIQDTRPKLVVFHRLEWFMALLGALGMLLGVFVGSFLSRPIAEPLIGLASAAESIAEGNLDSAHTMISGDERRDAKDEIGMLERSFLRMVRGLKERLAMSTFLSQATYEHICSDALDGAGADAAVRTSLAVLFSDVRGFTSFSETEPPEAVIALLNQVLSLQAGIVEHRNGDINKFIGDAVFAWFAGDDRCRRAVAAAQEIVAALNAQFAGRPGTQVGIGIHVGELVVGSVGSNDRRDYTAIGSVVNKAARLCSHAEVGQVLLSAEAAAEFNDDAALTPLAPISLKGITDPVPVFEVTRPATAAT